MQNQSRVNKKLLSIVIPAYNMEQFLPNCLRSVLPHDISILEMIEIIVVNDGSTDNTSVLAHEFENKHPQTVRVVDKANGHYGSCINCGLKLASGKYIKILDADDTYDTGNFANWIRRIEIENKAGRDYDMLLTDFVTVDLDGHITDSFSAPFAKEQAFDMTKTRVDNFWYPMHAIAYSTQMLRNMQYVQTEGVSYTDVEWVMYPLKSVVSVFYWPYVIYRYLVGRVGQSVDAKVMQAQINQSKKVLENLINGYVRTYIKGSEKNGRLRYLNGMANLLRNRYVSAFICGSDDASLREFDVRLKNSCEDLYLFLGEMQYSKKIPFKFIKAWRKHSWSLKFMSFICKMYSSLSRVLRAD